MKRIKERLAVLAAMHSQEAMRCMALGMHTASAHEDYAVHLIADLSAYQRVWGEDWLAKAINDMEDLALAYAYNGEELAAVFYNGLARELTALL